MNRNYEVLNELVSKTQELHRAIFDKGYEQGRQQVLDKIIAEIEEYKSRQLTMAIGIADLEKGKQMALEYILAVLGEYRPESEG